MGTPFLDWEKLGVICLMLAALFHHSFSFMLLRPVTRHIKMRLSLSKGTYSALRITFS